MPMGSTGTPRILRRILLVAIAIIFLLHFTATRSTITKIPQIPDISRLSSMKIPDYADIGHLKKAAQSALSLKKERQWHRVAKVSIFGEGMQESSIIERALKTHKVQNQLYEYQHLMSGASAPGNDDAAHTKSQAQYLLELLKAEMEKSEDERLEWIFWFEPNTVILNPHIPLEIFLPPANHSKAYNPTFDSIHMLLTTNWNDLNTAIFPLHVHQWSISLFENLMDVISKQPQTTLLSFLQERPELRSNVTVVPPHWFSSMPVKVSWSDQPPEGEEATQDPSNPEKGDMRYGHGAAIVPSDMPEHYKFDPNEDGVDPQPWKVRKGDMALSFPGSPSDNTKDPWIEAWLSIPEKPEEPIFTQFSNSAYIERLEREIGAFWEEEVPRIHKLWEDIEERQRLEREQQEQQEGNPEEEKRSVEEEGSENYHQIKEEERRKEANKAAWQEKGRQDKVWMEKMMGAEHGAAR